MRPTYETETDRQSELAVIRKIERIWKCTGHKLPKFYQVDYAFSREGDKIIAVGEVKCRQVTMRHYDTYLLSVHKIAALDSLASIMDVDSFLIVQWTDRLGYIRVSGLLPNIGEFHIGGRVDRADPQDLEPVAKIPIGWFNILE